MVVGAAVLIGGAAGMLRMGFGGRNPLKVVGVGECGVGGVGV